MADSGACVRCGCFAGSILMHGFSHYAICQKTKRMEGDTVEHVLSLSYGKDSLACIGAIEELGLTLDRIVHAEIWATDTIPADLPEMIEFKRYADAWIYERTGIKVEHIIAEKDGRKVTYERIFYQVRKSGIIYGWPMVRGQW